MKKILLSLLPVLLMNISQVKAHAKELLTAETNSNKAVQQLDSLFDFIAQKKLFNGNVLVAIDGKKVFSRSVGWGSLKTKEILTESSVFELASVSKQFTAAGILRLVAKKKISLDQDIQSILPDLPYSGVTVRMLLTHTSGLPDYMELFAEHWDSTRIATNKDIIPLFKKYKPEVLFAPGEKWEYSNTGYALLACVIEKVSGQSFSDYMKTEVFEPLNMKHTFVYSRRLKPQSVDHYAFGYVQNEDKQYVLPDEVSPYNPVYFLDGIQGDGTVNTTTGDMLVWNNALGNVTFLPAELWNEALTSSTTKSGEQTHYGYGWMITEKVGVGKILYHSGGWPGYVTYNVVYPDKKISIVYLSNFDGNSGTMQEIITAMKHITLGEPFTLPQILGEKKVADIDKTIYKNYVGTYNIAEGFDVVVTTENDHLYMQATGQGRNEVVPESSTKFFMEDYPVSIEFKSDASGKVTSFTLFQNGRQIPAIKK